MTLELVPVSQFPADEHAICPFDDLVMAVDADRGDLLCPECGCTAVDAAAHLAEVNR